MKLKKLAAATLVFAFAATSAYAQKPQHAQQPQQPQQKDWLFAFFREPGTQGVYFALSHDGYHYTPLKDDQPWIKPTQPGEIMRDIFITRGPDHLFHMVWTWRWRGNSFGYATSPDLIHWSAQRKIPIMQGFPNTRNVWAPRIFWDAAKDKWMVLWASTVGNPVLGNRLYYSLTKNFTHFTIPQLLYDPGYVVIDATIFHGNGKYYLVFKDQQVNPLRYQIRYATGPSLEGPWSKPSGPITQSWSEGPSVVHVGKQHIVYYDHYRVPERYEAVASTDWIHWKDINSEISLPAHCKHGSFLTLTPAEAARLAAFHSSER